MQQQILPLYDEALMRKLGLPLPSLRMTDTALQNAQIFLNKRLLDDPKSSTFLRLYLEGKGCDGFYYGIGFDQKSEGDFSFRFQDIDIIIDPKTYVFVYRSIISWQEGEQERGFLITNPDHGKFRGKFFKSPTWQERILKPSKK